MNKKEQTPLAVHRAIEPYLNKEDRLFVKVESENDLIRFKGSSSDSNFFFHVKSHRKNNNTQKNQVHIVFQPYTEESVESMSIWVACDAIKGWFDIWNKILDEYDEIKTVFDDPIIKAFKEEYYAEFEIIDEGAEPLSTKQILLLDSHLEDVEKRLRKYESEKNALDLGGIRDDISVLRENLTLKSKKWVIRDLSKIWAKIAKQGTEFIKEFLSESKKEIIKRGIKGLIEVINENSSDLLA